MKRLTMAMAAVAAAACSGSDNRGPAFYGDSLREIHHWDVERAAEGHYAYNVMVGSEPKDAVPVLIPRLADKTPSAIDDGLHDPPTVGHIAFHILMKIYGMKPTAFEREGVWVMMNDPSKNPIYMVKFTDDATREKLTKRFTEIGRQRGWMP
jgi:hypothetical protein